MDYDIQQQEKRLSKENRIVTVDTRPLIIREMSTTDTLEIPSNIVIAAERSKSFVSKALSDILFEWYTIIVAYYHESWVET